MASDRRSADPENSTEFAETIGLYALGEISLGKAAERAGVSRWEMRGVLKEAGVTLRLGPQDEEGLESDVDVALHLERATRSRWFWTRRSSATSPVPVL